MRYTHYNNIAELKNPSSLSYSWHMILYIRKFYKLKNSVINTFYLRDDLRESELFKELTQ